MSTLGVLIVGLVIALGLVGIVVPLLPGGLLVFAAIAVWGVIEGGPWGWGTVGAAAALYLATVVVKYLWPARQMRAAEVPGWVLVLGAVGGVVGFFVIPVLGLPIGFLLGVFAAELVLRRDLRRAAVSTWFAVKAVLLSVGVEFTGALLSALVWLVAVLAG
ncbi:MAG: DUF456 domain-containing protein [Mycolicibacterium insubricum]|jgi:uncharacterized protein YqgC (DUF456 family)|uniref:Uncharacterized protein n=1 Tax=Mycolicibacterium insubricum TaxID=444597 RepID=A0A1X0CVU3_9MYCO|nr:DUF456 domain-containing protein [Mycolicibacterium insubricum]MCB0926362.1 DUF456 domain-containing protein [Mycobacterium sp.]MCB9439600.1 DUF456 domain-containing protein [Mycolicibacterium sp.]MCV7082287.1 DUF456 domain-containing protein [Mycolicibacterium insubricum]ORA64198.1 hypothetical protein BST26_19965 [Mycolicibacterium insubricum]BBZ65320.1 membrane protein [Mycolicibacterium insubricum]